MLFTKTWLQFFADGSAPAGEGDGAATGVESGTPGQNLEDLGVPADKAERFRQRKKAKPAAPAPAAVEAPAAEEPATMSWEDFMKIPENNARMQKTISERVNKVGQDQTDFMNKLSPALELIANKYGIQPGEDGKYDPEALAQAVTGDDSYYEDKAEELGVDVKTARHIEELETANRRAEAEKQRQQRDEQLRAHFMAMQQQANDLQQLYPSFSLEQALNDPNFLRFTSPEVGMTVKQAFYALYGDDVQAQAVNAVAQRAKLDAANAVRSGVRPRENGSAAAAAVSSTPNIKTMKREDRLAYIKSKYAPPG